MTGAFLSLVRRPASRLPAGLRREWGVLAAGASWTLFFANFLVLRLEGGDSPVQYAWVQQLYGDPVQPWGKEGRTTAIAYFFGLGLVEAPFYGIAKLLDAAGLHDLGNHPVKPAVIAIGMGLLILPAWALLVRMLRTLDLPGVGVSLLTATLGTSVVFWAVFAPGKNHPADAALFTLVLFLTLRYFRDSAPPRWLTPTLGAILGFSITVRYFAGAEALALVAILAVFGRRRHAVEVAVTTAASTALLFLIPRVLHTPVFASFYTPSNELGFYPLNPLRMLFTDFRGLFVWTPVTALASIGLVLLFRRRPEHRRFLTAAYAMGLAIVCSYAFVPYWDGAWSFSQRFYTPLFPLVALGIAALLEAARGARKVAAAAALALATAWSLYLCFTLVVVGEGYYTGPSVTDGASGVAVLPARLHVSAGAYAWAIYDRSRLVEPLLPWPFSHPAPPP